MKRLSAFIAFFVLVAIAASVGARFMPGEWYAGLAKPWFTPPGWIFAPVWGVLYVMIATAGWLAWPEPGAGTARAAWGPQLVLNGAWSWLMFGLHRIDWALVDILLMLLAIAIFVVSAWRPARTASMLMMPYLAWVAFASALNLAIWRLNS